MSFRRLSLNQPASFAFRAEFEPRIAREIAKYPEGRQASAVIAVLWFGQEQEGWVTKAMIEDIARRLGMPFIRVLEVATFYTMFNLEPVGKHLVQVCTTTPCWLRGSDAIVDACKKHIAPREKTVSADGVFSWMEVECLGACVNAPMLQIGKDFYEDLDGPLTEKLLEAFRRGETPKPGPQNSRHTSEPEGGALTLKDPALYDGSVRRSEGSNGGGNTDASAKMPGKGAEDRESPVQKPPGAAT
jgi:NADH-quinone oxidoreductase subunit E